ncbi:MULTISPECIES: hypothetical protein [unclassified Chamaesiphon]|uniref:hypothetical protein n=1 Tax=unclassified Chamaesiphon TaxID=2620921 RepID=UPI00286BA83F|nr:MULTISPECIES: hypothetical protein [unclassified Chamaesiphon]
MSDSILDPVELVGYHGTNIESARRILDTGFISSRNNYDCACFQEGEEVYPNSAIYNKSHIQVAVRDIKSIAESILLTQKDF